jgi:hypothetical protein
MPAFAGMTEFRPFYGFVKINCQMAGVADCFHLIKAVALSEA